MGEIPLIIGPPVGWILWSLGGWDWVIGGKQLFKYGKILRRVLFPAWASLAALAIGQEASKAIIGFVMLSAFIWIVGYGDESKLRKLLGKYGAWSVYGIGIGIATSPFGISWYTVLAAITFPILTSISQKDKLHWKIVEGFVGLTIMLTILH